MRTETKINGITCFIGDLIWNVKFERLGILRYNAEDGWYLDLIAGISGVPLDRQRDKVVDDDVVLSLLRPLQEMIK